MEYRLILAFFRSIGRLSAWSDKATAERQTLAALFPKFASARAHSQDFDEKFVEMVEAAIEASQKGVYIEKLGKWRYLSEHFVGKSNTLAVKIDRKALELRIWSPA